MKPLGTPLFLICLLLFMVHQVLQKGLHLHISWMDAYLDNLLAMPIILSLWQAERILIFKKHPLFRLSLLEIAVATVYVSLISEVAFPMLSPGFHPDPVDVAFYVVGSFIYYGYYKGHKYKEKTTSPLPEKI